MSKSWIYATKPTPTTWDVLHTDYIPDQTTLYFICDANTRIGEVFCNRSQSITTVPFTACTRRIKSTITRMPNENSCRRLNGEFYEVRYTLPDRTIIPLYHLCYSKTDEHAVYSRHKSYGFNLAASTYRRPQFVQGGVVSPDTANSYYASNVYTTFVRLLGTNQKFIQDNTTLVFERGHLANSQDFPTYDQMDETFKLANVIPQFFGSNHGNWKRLENWIHKLATANTYADVVTGSFGLLKLPHAHVAHVDVPIYLAANDKNPVPLWLYKVVKYAGSCYAFLTSNNDFNTDPQINTSACRVVACPSGLTFNTTTTSGVSHCCNYFHFVSNIGNHAKLC